MMHDFRVLQPLKLLKLYQIDGRVIILSRATVAYASTIPCSYKTAPYNSTNQLMLPSY